MKKTILLLIFGLFLAFSGRATTIESAVYNFKISEKELKGQVLLMVKTEEPLHQISFFFPHKIKIFNKEISYEKKDSKVTIKNLNLTKNEKKKIVLGIESSFSGEEITFPLLSFPYKVEKTCLGVEKSRNKFVWRIDFPVYNLRDDDRILIQEKLSNEERGELDELMLELKKYFQRSENLPEYRIYLGEIKPNEEVTVKGWSGKSYQFYLPNVIPVIVISVVLLLLLYFILKRPIFSLEKEEEDEEEIGKVKWSALKEKCQQRMEELKGDEKKLYQEIFESKGEILQRDLPEKLKFSKAKVTRILDSLERKGLIERRSYGVTNKVILK